MAEECNFMFEQRSSSHAIWNVKVTHVRACIPRCWISTQLQLLVRPLCNFQQLSEKYMYVYIIFIISHIWWNTTFYRTCIRCSGSNSSHCLRIQHEQNYICFFLHLMIVTCIITYILW